MKHLLSTCLAFLSLSSLAFPDEVRPNIIFIMTDDQGYGDLACHGHPYLKTPNLDKLHGQSTRFTDYHVSPTCAPTRSALMSGKNPFEVGVTHTILGRERMALGHPTVAEVLQKAGYTTGIFGKWHLGEEDAYQPGSRGFDEVFIHGAGGIGQNFAGSQGDVPGNKYFDPTIRHNGTFVKTSGYCTDVFFAQALGWIKEQKEVKEKPFFSYIALNAPHGPFIVGEKYEAMYREKSKGNKDQAAFFGMITNIDDNVGATRKLIADLGIADNTIFIFTTDNGTASGAGVFNAGMRGNKGSAYDGGHRVPMFIHWPAAGLNTHRKIATLCHAVDVVPTLLETCGIPNKAEVKFDGLSLKDLIDPTTDVAWPERFLVTDSQRVVDPVKWRQSSVMSQQYRLINGKELYDITKDPGQEKNIAKNKPNQVKKMRAFYEAWWTEI